MNIPGIGSSSLKRSTTNQGLGAGTSGGGFSFGGGTTTPGAAAPSAPAASGFSFGGTTMPTAPPAATSTGFSFGGATTPAAPPPAASSATLPTAPPAAGMFSFAVPSAPSAATAASAPPVPAPAAPATPSAPPAPTATSGFSLGGAGAVPTPTAPPATTGMVPLGGPLGGENKKAVSFAPSLGPGGNLGFGNAKTPAGAGAAPGTAPAGVLGVNPAGTETVREETTIPPDMQAQTIAEIASDWTKKLEIQKKKFEVSCTNVKQWDDFLLQMNNDLNHYSKRTARQMGELETLDSSLDAMQRVHEEISRQLDTTALNVQAKIKEVTANNATAADKERDKNYELAEKVNGQVTRLTDQLRSIVERLNTDQEKRLGSESTIEAIEKVVDRHLRSLELIDRKAEDIAQSLGATQQITFSAHQSRRQ